MPRGIQSPQQPQNVVTRWRGRLRVLVLNTDVDGWCEPVLCVPRGNAGSALLLVAHEGMKL